MGLFNRFKKNTKENLLKYLQNRITDTTSLDVIVNVFEEMCAIPIKEDMILFETGTYSFTGEPMFNFSLVRQFPNNYDDEYYQLHVDILYMPSEENKSFKQSTWNDDIKENIFNYIKKSREFDFCKDKKISKIEIFLDET